MIRVREVLVGARTQLVNAARGFAKSMGERLGSCDPDQFGERLKDLPEALQTRLWPLAEEIESLTKKIRKLDQEVEQIAGKEYPETGLLRQVKGVGALIGLTYVLTIEGRDRFAKSRDVGCNLGLRPKRSNSGDRDPQLRITKEGDVYLRKLLVQVGHCILSRREQIRI